MSAMPVFSYAQAAKGAKAQAPPKPADQAAKVEPAELSAGTRTSNKTIDSTSSVRSRTSRSRPRSEDKESAASSTQSGSAVTAPTTASTPSEPSADKDASLITGQTLDGSESAQAAASGPVPPQAASETGSAKEKDATKKTEGKECWEKGSQSSQSPDKAAVASDKDKDKSAKDSEDDWDKVSVPSVAADKELKAAPLPAVNVWAVRLETLAKKKEQAAKASVNGTLSASEPAASKPAADDHKRKAGSRDTPDKAHSTGFSKADGPGKAASGNTDLAAAQSCRPVSQPGDKSATAARPPVDTTSWPTPENATADERRKPYSHQDKADKPDAPKAAATKSHGNKWITVPFVPTAKFETPLPALASKRGPRTGRGRDNQARGGAQSTANADRAEQTGPPAAPTKAQDPDRGRKADTTAGGRSSSLPASNRRPTSRENVLSTLRKPASPCKGEASQTDSTAAGNSANSQLVNGVAGSVSTGAGVAAAPVSGAKDQSRSSSRHVNGPSAEAATSQSLQAGQNGTDPLSASATDPAAAARLPPGGGQERNKASHYRSATEAPKDRGSHRNRDWSREKADPARDKVESWRDRDFSGESTGRRERSDRGRGGGGYRGRGGAHSYHSHQSHQSHQAHPYTSPLPQNGFDSAKPHHTAEPRSRQASQHFAPPPNSSNANRAATNPRSHSIPVGMMYSNVYGVPGMQHLVPQLQTDMPPYAYAAGPVPVDQAAGIMGAMPYSNSLNSYAVISMLVIQFEYYFSIDNLCKDMYLRQNMDSQGWVPLRVVANFKRIKALTEENFPWDMMRYVASQLRNAEHLILPDGEDKIRSRDNWRNFVLPMDDRFPAAQTEGPQLPPHFQQQQQQQHAHLFGPPPPPQANPDGLPALSSPVRSPHATVATPNGGFEPASLPPASLVPISPLDGAVLDRGFAYALSPAAAQQGSPPPPQSQPLSHPRQESPNSQQKSQYSRVFRDRPTGQIVNHTAAAVNGHRRQPSRNFTEELTFPDEGIAGIRILMRDPSADNVPGEDGAVTGAQLSRALSNESRASAANPSTASAGLPSDQSGPGLHGVVFGYSNQQSASSEPARFVNKDGLASEIPLDKPGQYSLSYLEAHETAFRNRALGFPDAMSTMYSFWSSFLVDNFNLGMYHDFKTTSIQDLANGDEAGIKHLVLYFDKALKSQAPIADLVATDLAHFLRDEADGKARVYKIMRMAWRNGALNLKTRKKIGDLLSDQEKASFDKGG